MISVYCDGSSGAGGGKPTGWAWVIVRDEVEVVAAGYGGFASGTNNQAELTGAIEGMKALLILRHRGILPKTELAELVSDSQYTLGTACGAYNASSNIELAGIAVKLAVTAGITCRTPHFHKSNNYNHKCGFRWVRGHTGNTWNERCDSLAGRGKWEHTPASLRRLQKKPKKGPSKRHAETLARLLGD